MPKRPTLQDLLDGIKENIYSTEQQILRLKRDLNALPKDGETVERRILLRQISTLEDNLQLLKTRWTHAVNPQHALEHSLAKPDETQGEK